MYESGSRTGGLRHTRALHGAEYEFVPVPQSSNRGGVRRFPHQTLYQYSSDFVLILALGESCWSCPPPILWGSCLSRLLVDGVLPLALPLSIDNAGNHGFWEGFQIPEARQSQLLANATSGSLLSD